MYQRFFRVKRDLSEWELSYLTNLDFRNHVALVAAVKGAAGWEPAGVARLVRLGPQGDVTKGEAAFTVLDAHQGRGIGTQLMVHLARIASALGYTTLEAEVLPDNRPMLTVFAHSGLPIREQVRDGIVHVELTLPRRQEASSAWSGSGAT